MKIVETLNKLIVVAFDKDSIVCNELVKFEGKRITASQALIIKNMTGIDIEGYKHTADNYAIRHIIIKHGNPSKEAKRGQIAVTVDDFKMIPEITQTPYAITYVGINNIGRNIVKYEIKIGNTIFCYLAEIRKRHADLALQTLYKRKAPY